MVVKINFVFVYLFQAWGFSISLTTVATYIHFKCESKFQSNLRISLIFSQRFDFCTSRKRWNFLSKVYNQYIEAAGSYFVGFVGDACWINGFYVYADLKHVQNSLGYYGIPTDVSLDGIYANGKYCATVNQQGLLNEDCTPLTKTFFLQYQWYPFFLASLAFLFYLPYMAFTLASNDTVSELFVLVII